MFTHFLSYFPTYIFFLFYISFAECFCCVYVCAQWYLLFISAMIPSSLNIYFVLILLFVCSILPSTTTATTTIAAVAHCHCRNSTIAHRWCFGPRLIISNHKYLLCTPVLSSCTWPNKYFWLFAIILKFTLSHLKYWLSLKLIQFEIRINLMAGFVRVFLYFYSVLCHLLCPCEALELGVLSISIVFNPSHSINCYHHKLFLVSMFV